jgi:hypothetical protein
MPLRHVLVPLAAACLLLPSALLADASILLDSADGETAIKVREGQVRISESENPSTVMLFDSTNRSLVLIDTGGRTYTRVNEASAREIRSQLDAAIKEAEEQIKALPPQQQEMMRSMMGELLDYGASVPRVEVRRDGGRESVDGVDCELVTVTYDGEPGMEACIAGHEELGISADDNEAIVAMFAFLTDFANTIMPSRDRGGWELSGMQGVPVMAKDADGSEVSRLKSVDKDALEPGLFEVPAGFTEQPLSVQ